jgi:uncharacterized protein YgiM (DUF1202 family)
MWIRAFLIYCACIYVVGAQALCVVSDFADLRAGPGKKHKVSWRVPKFTPLIEIKRGGGWVEVEDQDGERHWIWSKHVTSKIQCLSVRVSKASLRVGPGESFARGDIWFATKYSPFKRLDVAENGWYQVESLWGKSYWVSPNLVWRPVKVTDISY